jgi:hypothetical protein
MIAFHGDVLDIQGGDPTTPFWQGIRQKSAAITAGAGS